MSLVYNLKGDMTEDELDQESSNTLRDSLEEHFGDAVDHRRPGSIRHQLIDILFITICAVVSGANDLKAVAMYAKRKQNWLKNVLVLSNGVPSYTTFWTVFVLLSPMPLEQCFVKWVQSRIKEKGISASSASDINIDGKASRGTAKKGEPHSFVHIVSAWAAKHHLTLGQLKVDGKSNEITAIPQLLDMIDVAGSTVTIDAMGCQTAIAEKIVDKGGDYVLALKGNQGSFSDEVENYFCQAEDIGFEGVPCDAVGSKDQAHGRIEKREVYALDFGYRLSGR
jgi:predicted transposase YbfD/YdcC